MKIASLASSAAVLLFGIAGAASTSLNSGSLGSAANATNADGVILGVPGPLAAAGDAAAQYTGGSQATPVNTTLAYNPALNPGSSSPFTIEFWVNPAANVTDGSGPSPVFNRVSSSPRSGWVFFQRAENQGWNFAMYSGSGTSVGMQLTGGTYTAGTWSLVAVVFDGVSPVLYVNGVNVGATVTGSGYNASTAATLSIGSYDTGANPFTGLIDETALYGTALSASQLLGHYKAASNPDPTAYSSLVTGDGALLYLRNTPVPEPATTGLLLLGLAGGLRRRR